MQVIKVAFFIVQISFSFFSLSNNFRTLQLSHEKYMRAKTGAYTNIPTAVLLKFSPTDEQLLNRFKFLNVATF